MLRLLRRAGTGSASPPDADKGRSRPSSDNTYPSLLPKTKGPVSIRLNVPAHGGVFMTSHQNTDSTDPASTSQQAEFVDREVSGEIEIEVQQGTGPFKCRAIRTTLLSICRLYMGEARGWEEDVLFERNVELKGALVLEEGVQRLSFTILAPYSLPTWDTHTEGIVRNYLIATVDGLGAASPRASVPATTGRDLGNYPDGIPAPLINQLQTQMTVSWEDPVGGSLSRTSLVTMESSGSSSGSALSSAPAAPIEWLKGSVAADRCMTFLYNPHPTNGVNKLDERRVGDVPGLGPLDVRFMSRVWTVSAIMRSSISFPAPSPKVVVYYAQVLLAQIATVKSPRDADDAPPRVSRREFQVWEQGAQPPARRSGAKDHAAIYRGTAAGGTDTGAVYFSETGRIPNDDTARPSTLEGIKSPIHVKHELVAEVWYSVHGEDLDGSRLPKGGHGTLRRLRVDKPVILPSCAFIPQALELPSYEWHQFETAPCSTCNISPAEQACRTCPLTAVPHVRHDLDRSLFNCSGVCPECNLRFIPDVNCKWANCACGLSLQDLGDRLKLDEEWKRSMVEEELARAGNDTGRVKFGWQSQVVQPRR